MIGGPTEIAAHEYLIDQQVGGTLFTIPASHLLDTVREGLFETPNLRAIYQKLIDRSPWRAFELSISPLKSASSGQACRL